MLVEYGLLGPGRWAAGINRDRIESFSPDYEGRSRHSPRLSLIL